MPDIKVITATGRGTQVLGFDQSRDRLVYGQAGDRNPFKDLRVRQAVRLAIDKDALQSKIMRGLGVATSALYTAAVEARPESSKDRPLRSGPGRWRYEGGGLPQWFFRDPALQLRAARGFDLPGGGRHALAHRHQGELRAARVQQPGAAHPAAGRELLFRRLDAGDRRRGRAGAARALPQRHRRRRVQRGQLFEQGGGRADRPRAGGAEPPGAA